MPYDKTNWHGLDDGTPASRTDVGPADYPERGGGDWHGQDDATPSSKPTDPDKQQ